MKFFRLGNGSFLNLDNVVSATESVSPTGEPALRLFTNAGPSAEIIISGADRDAILKEISLDADLNGLVTGAIPPGDPAPSDSPEPASPLPNQIEISPEFEAAMVKGSAMLKTAGAWFAKTMEKFVTENGGLPRDQDPAGKIPTKNPRS